MLTTNGAALTKNMDLVLRAVTHLNLSRHAVDESANAEVFRSVKVPRLQDLRAQIGKFNAHGIPVNLNCVYTRSQALGLNLDVTSKSQLRAAAKSYISMAKELRASSIVFRSDHRGGLTDEGTLLEHCFDDFAVVHSASCASCRVVTKLIRGLPVNFKQSAYEPSALHPSDELYELIFHSDGLLYRDWSRKIPVRRPLRLSLEPWAEALFYGRHANLVLVPEECHSRPSCHVLATSHPGPF